MERDEALAISPIGSHHLVELVKPAARTSGGIWLPETSQENWEDAIVLHAGLGDEIHVATDDGGIHLDTLPVQVEEGERVVYLKHSYRPLHAGSKFGIISDGEIVCVIADDDVWPMNDWVLIEVEGFVAEQGSIALPEEIQARENHGVVKAWGEGRISRRFQNYGQRVPVSCIMNLAPDQLLGKRAHWGSAADAFEIGSETVQGVLVRAGDLLFITE